MLGIGVPQKSLIRTTIGFLSLDMGKFIKAYRKSVGLTDSIYDRFIRLIFVIHIYLLYSLFKPISNLVFDFVENISEEPYLIEPPTAIITIFIIHQIPRGIFWIVNPIIKKK